MLIETLTWKQHNRLFKIRVLTLKVLGLNIWTKMGSYTCMMFKMKSGPPQSLQG